LKRILKTYCRKTLTFVKIVSLPKSFSNFKRRYIANWTELDLDFVLFV